MCKMRYWSRAVFRFFSRVSLDLGLRWSWDLGLIGGLNDDGVENHGIEQDVYFGKTCWE